MLDVFQPGTLQVEKKPFCSQYVQIKYFEATWPADLVAHRIQPLHGSINAHTKKRPYDYQKVQAQNYASMLHHLILTIQEYLLLSDDDERSGALKSLELVGSTPQQRSDNRICIWLEDVWSQR